MENISQPVERIAVPLDMPSPDYLCDHHIGSLAVLPAVEALQILARSNPAAWSADLCRQEGAVFHHLLVIDPAATGISALQEHELYADGRCLSRLTSRRSGGRVARRMEHLRVWFAPEGSEADSPADPSDSASHAGPVFRVPADRLYEELVPFGPAYRNARGDVLLTQTLVSTSVYGGDFPAAEGPLGSPFPLDAAMHTACAWGQRYRNRVVFPVGFDRREIFRLTRTGETYGCRIRPLADEGLALRFDLDIYGPDGRCVEAIRGLRMKEIIGGKRTPPAWVREGL